MKTFSQRNGLAPVRAIAQTGAMDDPLRNSLWNALSAMLFDRRGFLDSPSGGVSPLLQFAKFLWVGFLKEPVDTIPASPRKILESIRQLYFGQRWNGVYDLLEHIDKWDGVNSPRFESVINAVLDSELAGYRLIDRQIVEVTDEAEVRLLTEALADDRFAAPTAHLRQAMVLMSNRENPDYRNSIKESISAVESMARILAPDKTRATLGDAIYVLEKQGRLHSALREGFSKLYGYTNDADGIRHAMMDEPDLTLADARYFLLSCTSFVNYLKSQA